MKKYYFYIFAIAALMVTGFSSCTDLDRYPLEQLSDGSFWKTANDAEMAVSDLYKYVPSYEQDDAINSDDARHGIKWAAGNISKGIYDPQDMDWSGNYACIRKANLVLSKIDEIPNMNADTKAKIVGQAKFFRAMEYFLLTRAFGDVPYTESPLQLSDQAGITRTSKTEIYKKFMADFDEAAANLPVEWGASDYGRITKGAAYAMKARAALNSNDWQTAADAAKKCMDLNAYELFDKDNTGKYAQMFWNGSDGCKEFVLVCPQKAGTDYACWLLGWEAFPTMGWGGIDPTQSLVDAFEDIEGAPISKSKIYDPKNPFANRDPRCEVNILHDGEQMYGKTIKVAPLHSSYPTGIGTHGDATETGYYQNKWLDPNLDPQSSGWDYDRDEVVIRYAEVLLTYAEAMNELHPLSDEAFDAVNQVRARVGMPALQKTDPSKPTYCADQEALRQRIRNERRVEFALECGLRQWDIRRWGIAKQVLNAPYYGISYKLVDSPNALPGDGGKICILYEGTPVEGTPNHYEDHNLLYPIPQSEIDLNPNLTQNPGY